MAGDSSNEDVLDKLRYLDVVLGATNRLMGLVDTAVLAQRGAIELQRALGTPLTSVAIRQTPELLVMRGSTGTRTTEYANVHIPIGQGLGGKVLVLRQPVSVSDYERDPLITKEFADLISRREEIHGMTGVPLEHQDELVGVLYAGIRHVGLLEDRATAVMEVFAQSLGSLIGAANASESSAELKVKADRRRIANDLHDNVGQLLFGIGVSAHRVRKKIPDDATDLVAELKAIEAQTSMASSCLREAIRTLGPSTPTEALPVMIKLDADAFASRSSVATDCIVLGRPVSLDSEIETTLLAVVREGLHNVEKHASARSVILTLCYRANQVEIIIQDDGKGIVHELSIDPLIHSGDRWGIASLLQRIERLGGTLSLIGNEDGGTTLRAVIPRTEVVS